MIGLQRSAFWNSAIAEGDALYAAMVRSAADPIIAISPAGQILSWNDAAAGLFGMAAPEAIGRRLGAFLLSGAELDVHQALGLIFAGEQSVRIHASYARSPDKSAALTITLSPVRDAAGTVAAASAILHAVDTIEPAQRDPGDLPLFAHLFAAPVDHDAMPADKQRNILVVEDEPLIGLGLAAMLEIAGFDVIGPARTVEAATALLDRHPCALAILDINLGRGETSAPLAQRLNRDNIPFFVTSGNLAAARPADFGQAPGFAKPVAARTLVAAIHEVLG